MELMAMISLSVLAVVGIGFAAYAIRELQKHVSGESARISALFETALAHVRAHSLTEKVDADARKQQHDLGLSFLRDSYEKEIAELREKAANGTAAPKLIRDEQGREFNLEELEPM